MDLLNNDSRLKFFTDLLNAIPVAVYHSTYDRQNDRWTIRYVSPGVEKLLGYKPRDLEDVSSFKDLVLSHEHHYKLFQQLDPKHPNFRITFEFAHKNGEGCWVSDDGVVLFDEDGLMCGSMGVFVDIAEQRAKELAIHMENLRLKTTIRSPARLGGMVGKSLAMQEVFARIIKMALTTAHVVIIGESGTGKELAARAIHDLSNRYSKPFIAVNCSSISENLFESEFFGHVKGAFTGAQSDRLGYLDAAEGGTLFLDEVGEIPLNMQSKLLRVLDGYGYMPVGGSKSRRPNFRLISATNRNLETLLRQGRMREDFYYRLNAVSLYLPPLRERQEDIPILIEYFLRRDGQTKLTLPDDFYARLLNYSWPGNIRELQNVLSRYKAVQETELEENQGLNFRQVLPPEVEEVSEERQVLKRAAVQPSDIVTFAEFERRQLLAALNRFSWQIETAARYLKISRSTIYRKMKKYDISKK